MKKIKILLYISLIAAIAVGMTLVSCSKDGGNDDNANKGGYLTITGLSEFEGRYVFASSVASPYITMINNVGGRGVKINNGVAKDRLGQMGDSPYSGNDNASAIRVRIYEVAEIERYADPHVRSSFLNVSFRNGNATIDASGATWTEYGE